MIVGTVWKFLEPRRLSARGLFYALRARVAQSRCVETRDAVTDARAQTQRDNAFDKRSLARVAAALAGLPAVATQDWVDQAASTLAGMDPCCRVGIAIAQAEPTGQIRSV